ncbi:MAG: Gfo/Idh/MocA family oxidoreductase, partial [Planctomycetota bacterium]|nr:Gfo/Idh/MocA family oxidoreductase [Planctomycetota bacterium]
MSELGFGLVGFGLFGRHHARSIVKARGAELRAIAAPSAASRAAAGEAHPGIAVHADYREVVSRDDVDVVDVVAPNHLHHEIARAALEAGKHVLLEKPMALGVEECDELAALAGERRRVLALNHELRLSSLWGGVKRLLDEGAIGKPRHLLVELSRFPYRQGSTGWRHDPDRVGSWILEEPIHFFDLARWYMEPLGEPAGVYARASSRNSRHPGLADNFTALVDWPDGGYAVVSQTLAAFGHHVSAKVTGTSGAIWAQWGAADARSEQPTFSLRHGDAERVVEVELERPAGELVELDEQLAAMVRCVREGEK